MRESWQARLAKKIAEINTPDLIGIYSAKVTDYWNATLVSFEEASRDVTTHFDEHRKRYESLLNAQEDEARRKIEPIITSLESQKSFFDSIPWREESNL